MTLILNGTDNSATVPAVQGGTAGTSTGLYYPSTNQVAISTAGTQAVFVNASQQVGIGASTLTAKLTINGNTIAYGSAPYYALGAAYNDTTAYLQYTASTKQLNIQCADGTTGGFTTFGTGNGNERMRIDSSGNVGIGTSSPARKLDVRSSGGTVFANVGNSGSDNNGAGITFTGSSTTKNWFIGNQFNVTGAFEFTQTTANGGTSPAATPSMVIDSSGNVGIGTSSPDAPLTVQRASYFPQMDFKRTGIGAWYVGGDNVGTDNNFHIYLNSSTNFFTIDTAGNVGIGTSSPGYKLDVASGDTTNGQAIRIRANATSASGGLQFTDSAASTQYGWIKGKSTGLSFYGGNNSAGDAFIDTSGNLLVGATTTGVTGVGIKFQTTNSVVLAVSANTTNATDTYNMYSTGAGAYRFYVDWAGTIHATSTVITAISDQRLKENVRDIDTGLDAVMLLKPRRFDWKEGKGQDKKNVSGFIAQEFEQIFPESVGVSKAGEDGIEYKNINYETLIPTLVKAIQELKTLVDTQASTITSLTARIEALEST